MRLKLKDIKKIQGLDNKKPKGILLYTASGASLEVSTEVLLKDKSNIETVKELLLTGVGNTYIDVTLTDSSEVLDIMFLKEEKKTVPDRVTDRERQDSIERQNAITNACNLLPLLNHLDSLDEAKERLEEWASIIYGLHDKLKRG